MWSPAEGVPLAGEDGAEVGEEGGAGEQGAEEGQQGDHLKHLGLGCTGGAVEEQRNYEILGLADLLKYLDLDTRTATGSITATSSASEIPAQMGNFLSFFLSGNSSQ